VRVDGLERRRRVTGFRQTGGRVLEILAAGGGDLGRGVTTGAIEGIVVDSMGLPLTGVRVGYVGSSQMVFTNSEGRFNMVGLSEGTYRIRFVESQLESFGLTPPQVTREVVGGVSSYLEFHVPSLGDMLQDTCQGERSPDTGVLAGIVRQEGTNRPLEGVTVRVRWSRFEVTSATLGVVGREAFTIHETATDPNGFYRFCAVPTREELAVGTTLDGVDSAIQTLALSGQEEGRFHIILRVP
jgi:hypothetical protein